MTRILVIGAGVAGLAAARQLRILGLEVEVIEAATRPGGQLAKQPLCVVEPAAQSLLAELGLEKLPPTTVVQEDLPQASETKGRAEGWRRHAARWRGAFKSPVDPSAEPGTPPPVPSELASGLAVVDAMANEVPIRFGWEVVDVAANERGATVRYVAPSGERAIEASGVIVSMPFGKSEPGDRRMTVFFESEGTPPNEGPIALHRVPPADSGATDVWTLHAGGHATTRIDLSGETSQQLWNLPDEEIGTSFWDLLPSALSLTGGRPAVHRFTCPGSPVEGRSQEDPRVVRIEAANPGLACALAAGLEAAGRLT
ncbi:MAG: FAD-dependent oxidoreductase [Deltaproteobacteria bacterium]|nr:FAD-dependent oxidoreductase [Deltaproteobacteria bacterium]MBW2394622.1 FAD-dependent oxidoreductase [Deltaproteobacteria bacterium]